mmetsp:Transcript_25487/g.71302  ORF Transcript_25487/g.71302 Transcript_25487/m.71302 type:complete len:290 (-) Transcript_25487:137-1006(-)
MRTSRMNLLPCSTFATARAPWLVNPFLRCNRPSRLATPKSSRWMNRNAPFAYFSRISTNASMSASWNAPLTRKHGNPNRIVVITPGLTRSPQPYIRQAATYSANIFSTMVCCSNPEWFIGNCTSGDAWDDPCICRWISRRLNSSDDGMSPSLSALLSFSAAAPNNTGSVVLHSWQHRPDNDLMKCTDRLFIGFRGPCPFTITLPKSCMPSPDGDASTMFPLPTSFPSPSPLPLGGWLSSAIPDDERDDPIFLFMSVLLLLLALLLVTASSSLTLASTLLMLSAPSFHVE